MNRAKLLKKLSRIPIKSQRKRRFIAVAGIAGLTLSLILIVWISVATVRVTKHQLEHADLQGKLLSFKDQLGVFPSFATASCWEKTKELIQIDPWMTRSFSENLNSLKSHCFNQESPACDGSNCAPSRIETKNERRA